MTSKPMTFGLAGTPDKVYDILITYRSTDSPSRKEKYRASGLDAVRKHILYQTGHVGHAVMKVSLDGKVLGRLEVGLGAPTWNSNGKVRQVSRSGKLLEPRTKIRKNDFKKFSAMGIPIYKIWYSNLAESYDVLGRKYNGEWVYGRDYDLKTGVWNGGSYNFDIDALYNRVNGPAGHVFINNRRGPTGRF